MAGMSNSLQENLLTLLCFDKETLPLLSNVVKEEHFESSVFREIAKQATNYYKTYKTPVAEHLPDVMEHILHGKDETKADLFGRTIQNIYESRDSINTKYVIDQMENFVRKQNFKLGLQEAVGYLQKDDLDAAERVIDQAKKKQVTVFDAGVKLTDFNKSFGFLDTLDDYYHVGIEALDILGICPAPKELYTLCALPNRGKTWALIHIGKYGLRQRKRVLHITLEMSEDKITGRYYQSLFGIAKNRAEMQKQNIVFRLDDFGKVNTMDLDDIDIQKIHSYSDANIRNILKTKVNRMRKPQLIVKEFPTGQLTMQMLEGYLDNLEYLYNWIPDIIIVDYADLMAIDSNNQRIDTGRIYKELRGLAVARNIAMVTASQINRSAEGQKLITSKFLAEDFSKVMISDNLLIYNQTPQEYELGLARLFVDKSRNDRKGDIILLSQNYSIGQYCLSSARVDAKYWRALDVITGKDEQEE